MTLPRRSAAINIETGMSLPATILIGLPCLLSGLTMGLAGYLKRFPARCDDVWSLPKPTSLR